MLAATAILMLDIAVVNTALPTLQADLDTDLHALKWVLDAYTLALASVVLTAGSLADRFGRRRLFLIGVIVFTLSSAAAAAAGSIEFLIAARAVQGLGAALMFAVSLALLSHAFRTPQERTTAFAAYGAAIGASFALGPFVGGLLTEALGWEWVFLINVPIGIAVLAITATKLVESSDPNPPKIDIPGQVTLVAGLFALVYGLLNAAEDGWGAGHVVAALAAAAGLLVAFVAIEATSRAPMVPLGMFRNRRFAGAQLAAMAISAGLFSTFIYIMIFLQQVKGYSPMEAGLVLVPGTMVNLFCAAATAKIATKVAPVVLISGGLGLAALGMVISALMISADMTWLELQLGFIVSMAGTGLFNPSVSAVALDVPERVAGLATGIHDTARQAGVAIGIAALGTLVSVTDIVGSLQDVMWAGAAIGGVGALASLYLFRPGTTGLVPVPQEA
ncbi:MFS transporter [Solirubrobacter phytolaccae]|uniref:MFS transporter n=1 Tax=Solirubrobacter phytolaccae TaxID=1404360 RepID=A0A9X3SI19_9ACTN|nr:MFS transporter [Solirubrobacter phytolaccae]MDA0183752.1 MFS transporter [Solirubrobacter phytolaccae]